MVWGFAFLTGAEDLTAWGLGFVGLSSVSRPTGQSRGLVAWIRMMPKKMETTIVYWEYIGFWVCIGIMQNRMGATV